jgi:hypothetical protein
MLSGTIISFNRLKRCVSLQIMGFDILLTKDLRPILLEVNASPSLTIDHYLPSPVSTTIIDEPLSTVDHSSSIEPTTIQIRSIIDEVPVC